MAEHGIGDFFITDADEVAEIGGVRVPPVIIPSGSAPVTPQSIPGGTPWPSAQEQPPPEPRPEFAQEERSAVVAPATRRGTDADEAAAPPTPSSAVDAEPAEALARPSEPPPAAAPPPTVAPPQAPSAEPTREQQLVGALNGLMDASEDIEAAALVSLDGFIMAAALPEGMHEDKVGAMSAAILGLGERAAIELGRGNLTQVFIEGEGGYVVLIAVGDRAVLTVLAGEQAKLGLVLYDMRTAAETIARLLG